MGLINQPMRPAGLIAPAWDKPGEGGSGHAVKDGIIKPGDPSFTMINNELCEANADLTLVKNDIYLDYTVVEEEVYKGDLHGIDCLKSLVEVF